MQLLRRNVASFKPVPRGPLARVLVFAAVFLGVLSMKGAAAQNFAVGQDSIRFFIDYPEVCTVTVEAMPAQPGMTQEQLSPYEHWCTVRDSKNSLVEIQIFTSAFALLPQHVSIIAEDPDGFWKWLLEGSVKDSLNSLSQRTGAELISSSYRMQLPHESPPEATACLTYGHDFQIESIPLGERRSDNSGLRCVVYDSTSNVVSNVLLEYIENRPGSPKARNTDFDTEAQKTFRSLQILGARSEPLSK